MTQYIEPNDYDASVHREIIDAITREDNSILDICEDRAIEEMKSYMAGRYDVDRIFAARGEERHPLILMMCLDIAVYHIYSLGNPAKMSSLRENRYERAVEWLKGIQKGNVVINGAPTLQDENKTEYYLFGGNRKRCNHL